MAKFPPIVIEGAEVWMRTKNFSGEVNRFGSSDRTFCIFLDEANAEAMAADGWRVKMSKPREGEEKGRPYLSVSVRYDVPDRLMPKIYRVTSKNKVLLNKDTVSCLHSDTFLHVDLIINPRVCEDGHIKAFCKEMWVTVEESPFYAKYMQTLPEYAPQVEGQEETPW